MSLSHLLAAVWFILVGITWAGWQPVGAHFLGIWAIVTGIVWLVEPVWSYTIPLRRPAPRQ